MRTGRYLMGSLAVMAWMLAPSAEAGDPHVRFRVGEPFRVGNHAYDAGVITLERITSFSPSRSILEVWVNNECLGMMPALRSKSEAHPQRTEALFRRGDDGRLEMVGFQVTGEADGSTYRFPSASGPASSGTAVALAYSSK